ncbi:transglutaminase TgpA family protein [Phycicoccus flavus]|uniref:Transglutaminase domain-containing protein n=1 Tax=Phycicoccus flavus TaxID=2502783 RepID=A0A8T6QZK4_9MICO|nr:DUF3488 and transglutaminase-like domain-containing protein [Phycicoccus flavus]NHA66802.1 transglutaminase domain-containing protein [Phycicoccus flavus]
MTRSRLADVLLGVLATLLVTLPLADLFAPTGAWARPSLLLVALVALTGLGLRALTTVRPLVVAGQLLVLLEGTALLHGRGHLWAGVVPTTDTGAAFGVLLTDAYTSIVSYSAPVPAGRGAVLGISLLVGLTGLLVDAVAVTYRSPALAGIPLLTAFLSAATNTTAGLASWLVVPPALAWLALVGRQGVGALRSWGGTASAGDQRTTDPAGSFATVGRVVGVVALAAAVVVPGLVPHLPTTFVADGLARGNGGSGGGGAVRLSTSVDIARDLAQRSTDPVLVYRTSDPRPQPLRVGLLDTYEGGQWTASRDATFVPLDGRLPGSDAVPAVERTTERIEVSRSTVGLPQVALPENAVGTPFAPGSWQVTASGLVQLTRPTSQYTVEYVSLQPEPGQFAGSVDPSGPLADDLAVDAAAGSEVRALLDRITAPGDTPLETAVKIQDHLRGPGYTYSEDLVDETADGRRPEEPLVRFLETRTGYCVQFSSAMIMMARAAGIPARMAVGFLPGSLNGEERVITAEDAHAWPELYFPDLGWMRFEPTPGVRSGLAPAYAVAPAEDTGTETSSPEPTASATPTDPTRPEGDVTADNQPDVTVTPTTTATDVVRDHLGTVLGVLGVLLLAALTPLGAWLARRRARRDARDDARRVEAEWQSLLSRLGDIGLVPGDGATPRQASRQIGRAAYLSPDENAALTRVVDTLEQARYARPGAPLPDVADDAHTVWRAALGRRRRLDQARALLLPAEGRRHWTGLFRRSSPTSVEDDSEQRTPVG